MAGTSFLATVKDELAEKFATIYDELSPLTSDQEALAEHLQSLHKDVWKTVEQRLKESFLNGKKAVNGKPEHTEEKPRKANPFRKQ